VAECNNRELRLESGSNGNNGLTGTSAIVNVIVNTCLTPVITASGPTNFCSGSVVLKTNSVQGNIYQWKKDGVNISGATNFSYTASISGDYQVKVIQGSCIAWSSPIQVRVGSGLSASITPGGPTVFCTGGNVMLYANTCSGFTYQWKKDAVNIPGATGSSYMAAASGSYQLQVTQGTSSAWSSLVTVQVNSCRITAIEKMNEFESVSERMDPSSVFEMKVYPNPNNGLFTIGINMAAIKEEKINMTIVNMLGEAVYTKDFSAQDEYIKEVVELDKTLPAGIYILRVMIGNIVENTNMVLAK